MNDFLYRLAAVGVVILSASFHEAAHAYAADKMGDPTAKMMGRMTLNPIKHISIIGSIVVPLVLTLIGSRFLFAWAEPVPVNPGNFHDRKKGEIVVSAAGPLANVGLFIISGLFIRYLFTLRAPDETLVRFIFLIFQINVMLCFFNLLPIPPLDGSHILEQFLSYRAKNIYHAIAPFSFILIILLIQVISPFIFFMINFLAKIIIGV